MDIRSQLEEILKSTIKIEVDFKSKSTGSISLNLTETVNELEKKFRSLNPENIQTE